MHRGCELKVCIALHANHRCNKRFLRFYSGHVFQRFFNFFHVFYLKKTLSNAKYKYVKIQRKIFLEDDLAMIFIDCGLLRSLYCKISYLLAEEHWSHTNLGIWQRTYDSVCKVGFMANVGNVFYPTFTNVFFIFSTFFNIFIFISTFITSMMQTHQSWHTD